MWNLPRSCRRGAVALAAVLVVAACGSPPQGAAPAAATGEPRSGGEMSIIAVQEPRSLDPAQLSNSYGTHGAVGNALYGQLLRLDPMTGVVTPALAESASTTDGRTWTLKLRPGVTFSDGTPFDAAAVKVNWDRMKDPVTAIPSNVSLVAVIESTRVVDATTLEFTFKAGQETANFEKALASGGLTYVASPKALAAGPQAFDAKPVGAGPFVLESWTRGGELTLVRNPTYFDAPRPYLERLVLRADVDQGQRFSALQAGDVDMVVSSSQEYTARAAEMGLVATSMVMNGGAKVVFNAAKAPFDDLRARQAIRAALDLDQLNQVVYGGKGTVPTTLMAPGTPFYEPDVLLYTGPDRTRAQQLFDELAAAGKPVDFVFSSFANSESLTAAESIQAQLATFKNVTMRIESLDYVGASAKLARHDFQAAQFGSPFVDPYPSLPSTLGTGLSLNYGRVSDPELDKALAAGNATADVAARKAAYRIVQQREAVLVPEVYYQRVDPALLSQPDIGGIEMYGLGSPRVDLLWRKAG